MQLEVTEFITEEKKQKLAERALLEKLKEENMKAHRDRRIRHNRKVS